MQQAILALMLVVPAGPPASQGPCAPRIGGRHEPAFVGRSAEDLDFQRRCLIWEYAAEPKVELLPPVGSSLAGVRRIGGRAVTSPPSSDPFADLVCRSIGLKPGGSGSDGASDRRDSAAGSPPGR